MLQGGANNSHIGNPAFDTASFGSPPGNLRADYVLPSSDLAMLDGQVFWFADNEPLFPLVTHGSFPSDHRLVYVDVQVVPEPSAVKNAVLGMCVLGTLACHPRLMPQSLVCQRRLSRFRTRSVR
jgi:hypothetical protein